MTQLPPLDEVTYEVGLRCSTGPLPTAGQLLLPGQRYAVPLLPLRDRS
jgi:hypothetical protein